MNALVTIAAEPSARTPISPPPGAEPVPTSAEAAKHTIFSPRHQAAFLENLASFGNVRLACRAARVSPQTAYRTRRRSPALAHAWDAALLAARHVAEEVLADRALNGVEEAIFYHGEEIATRRRYDSRLLLAHLARLDALADRADIAAALPLLDDQIETLRRGESLPEAAPEIPPQDRVPCVPSCMEPPSGSEAVGQTGTPSSSAAVGRQERPSSSEAVGRACNECGGQCDTPGAQLNPADCMWLGNRLDRMDAARPHGAPLPYQLGGDPGASEALQLAAFEAGEEEWWMLTDDAVRGA